MDKYTCHATRLEAGDAAFPVLLNGQPATLPAILTSCPHPGSTGVTYILDNEKMAMLLANRDGQVTQISYPQTENGGRAVDRASAEEGWPRRCLWNLLRLCQRSASAGVCPRFWSRLPTALKNNPAWKLQVNGHTDNVGGDAYNLDLSNRRAAAVKRALVTQYHLDPARLNPKGFGATQPKESNDTPQGRARNRRVELIRE